MNAVAGKGKWVAPASFGVLVAALLVSGCASYPISKDVREQAQPVTFNQVRTDPGGTHGTVVIWGGRIINVVNQPHGSSVYIVGLPLKSDEKPDSMGPSPGRFVITTTNFLDPTMLPQGRKITVAGTLNGVWTEQLGTMPYAYPVVEIQELHVWPTKSEEDYPYYGYYGTDWDYYGWGWGPGWGWYGGLYYPAVYYHDGHGFHGGFHNHGGEHGEFHGGGGGFHESGGGFHGGGGGGFGGGFHGGGGGGGHGR